jgi:methylmalonyl-CoA/ethylmalonyl-CoA epimerase
MLLNLSHIGQIGLAVSDVDRAEKFYETVIGLRKLYRFGDLIFFDCAGVRLLLEKTRNGSQPRQGGVIYLYFRRADISLTVAELRGRGVVLTHPPHLIASMDDHDLWMAFFDDPDGNTLAVMQEAPKGMRYLRTDRVGPLRLGRLEHGVSSSETRGIRRRTEVKSCVGRLSRTWGPFCVIVWVRLEVREAEKK